MGSVQVDFSRDHVCVIVAFAPGLEIIATRGVRGIILVQLPRNIVLFQANAWRWLLLLYLEPHIGLRIF